MACHVKRIPLCEAEFTEVATIHAALAQRGFNVEIRPRGNDVTSVCIRTGEARKEVYCKDCKFEVHIGYKDNSTAKPEDSVVVQGTKGWKGVRGVENSGIPMIDEIERLLRKQGSPVLDDAETTIPRVTEERPSRRNDAFWGQARPMPTWVSIIHRGNEPTFTNGNRYLYLIKAGGRSPSPYCPAGGRLLRERAKASGVCLAVD